MLVLIGPEDLLQWVALSVIAAVHPPEQEGWVAEALVVGLLAGFAAGSVGLCFLFSYGPVRGAAHRGRAIGGGRKYSVRGAGKLGSGNRLLHGAHAGVDMAVQPDKLAIDAGIELPRTS